jgi:hypothetical protein
VIAEVAEADAVDQPRSLRLYGVVSTPSSPGAEGALEIEPGHGELGLVGTARADREMDAAHADAHLGAELEELEADGLHSSAGELGMFERDTAHGVDEDVSHGREVEAQLIGLHGGGGRAVGKELELFADAVLGFAAGAINKAFRRAPAPRSWRA